MSKTASATATSSSSGMGIGGLLTVIFVVCKIFNFGPIGAWSWWWVFSPLWIGFAVVAGVLLMIGLVALVVAWAES